MAYELPIDLITQLQISTRAQAGLSDYDPDQSSQFPGLPSLSENIASLDPSPPYLRCKHCKGRLLRDIQSLLCIYCGRLNDVALPDPISFKDTFGYSWLLQSLHLDGSEMVEPLSKKNESKRGQSTPKDKLPLSDFLNLKIYWSAESSENKPNKKVEHSLTWPGIELNNFFLESKTQKSSEQTVLINEVKTEEIKTVTTHDNLSLFKNVEPSESTNISSTENKDFDSSEWKADFQLPDTQNSRVDLSVHMDSVFGSGKDEKLEASSISVNSTSNDFWNDNSEVLNNVNNTSTSNDWFQGNEWESMNKNIPQKDDSFDEWNDFTGLSTSDNNQRDATNENKFGAMDFSSFSEPDLFSGLSSNNQAPISNRVVDGFGDIDKILNSSSNERNDNVQMLMSQMRDLSFMLGSDLSIPSKSDHFSFP